MGQSKIDAALKKGSSTLILNVLSRLEMAGDRGLPVDRIMAIAGHSYYGSPDGSGRRKTASGVNVLIDRLIANKWIEILPIPRFAIQGHLDAYKITKEGLDHRAKLKAEFDRRSGF
jgi:hypothetical protein